MLNEVTSIAREIEPAGEQAVESRTYDANFNVEDVTHPEGQVTHHVRDGRGLLDQVTRGYGTVDAVTEHYGYDGDGERTSFVNGRGKTFSTDYDGYGRVAASADPLGNHSTTAYDDAGNPVEAKSFDAGGALLAHTVTELDLRNRPRFERRKLWTPDSPGVEDVVTETRYDALGNVVTTVDPRQRETSFGYDSAERRTSSTDPMGNRVSWTLDASGHPRLVTQSERLPDGATVETSASAVFDALGRAVESRDGLGNVTTATYDARGHAVRVMDPEGYFTESVFDGLDRLTRTVRPEGISVDYGYDKASRLRTYRDALDQTTSNGYDALDRRTSTTYPDTRVETVLFDGAGNPRQLTDGLGTVVTQAFDDANRLTARTVAPAEGVEGPQVESYGFDGLGRLTQASSGSISTTLAWDSLSRLRAETTAGRTVSFELDVAGNRTLERYPSGLEVARRFDGLNRPGAIEGVAQYGYRGPDLVASKTRGGVVQSLLYDAARRLTEAREEALGGLAAHAERLAWSPRGLKSAIARSDEPGASLLLGYDGAGRLTRAANLPEAAVSLANNTLPPETAFTGAETAFGFGYDAAENLLTRIEREEGVEETTSLPLDGSGRNRPGSIDGVALGWDGNGNLVRKGDLDLHYDFRNRLTRVTRGSEELVRYRYDAFNRRVETTSGGMTRETVWSGWQPVETRRDGALESRRIYGLGFDEIARQEVDLDGDGTTDTAQLPVYDSTGSLVAILDPDGKPVERYRYTPYGERTVLADLTPPEVEQVRVVGEELWLEASEAVSLEAIRRAAETGALTLTDTTTGSAIALEIAQPVTEGPNAGRRQVLTLSETPEPGTALRLHLEPSALVDEFQNAMAESFERDFAWPGTGQVIADEAAPRLQAVRLRSGRLEIELNEEANPTNAAAAIQLDGAPTTDWTVSEDRYVIMRLAPGTGVHTLTISTSALDLDGKGLASAFTTSFQDQGLDRLVYRAPDPREAPESAAGNRFGFHGLERDPATGLVYMRNRWYDPEMGRFVTADPLGYLGGPSTHAFAGQDPLNSSDPLGLYQLDVHFYAIYYLARLAGFSQRAAERIGRTSQYVDDWPRSSPTSVRNNLLRREQIEMLHFPVREGGVVVEGEPAALRAALTAGRSRSFARLGVAMHTLADTFSHAGFTLGQDDRNVREGSIRPNRGHADAPRVGQAPDLPFLDVDKAVRMAKTALSVLQQVYSESSKRPAPAVDMEKLETDLRDLFGIEAEDEVTRSSAWRGFIEGALNESVFYDREDPGVVPPGFEAGVKAHVGELQVQLSGASEH